MPMGDQSVVNPPVPPLDVAVAAPGPGDGPGRGVGVLSDGELDAHVRELARGRTVAELEPGRDLLGRDLLTALSEVDRRHPPRPWWPDDSHPGQLDVR